MSKILKSILFILTVNVIGMTLSSCPGPAEMVCLELDDMSAYLMDNSGEYPVIATNDSVTAAAFVIGVNLSSMPTVCQNLPSFQFGINSCYATKRDIEFVAKTEIISMAIYSDHSFGIAYPAGTNILDHFHHDGISRLNQYLTRFNSDAMVPPFFYLKTLPEESLPHQFVIELILANDSIVRDTTDIITLVK